jgi:hypothetical protein
VKVGLSVKPEEWDVRHSSSLASFFPCLSLLAEDHRAKSYGGKGKIHRNYSLWVKQREKCCRAWPRHYLLMEELNLTGSDNTLVYLLLSHKISGH